jgi:hypothetical protein
VDDSGAFNHSSSGTRTSADLLQNDLQAETLGAYDSGSSGAT